MKPCGLDVQDPDRVAGDTAKVKEAPGGPSLNLWLEKPRKSAPGEGRLVPPSVPAMAWVEWATADKRRKRPTAEKRYHYPDHAVRQWLEKVTQLPGHVYRGGSAEQK